MIWNNTSCATNSSVATTPPNTTSMTSREYIRILFKIEVYLFLL
jgi:hypothetical protein